MRYIVQSVLLSVFIISLLFLPLEYLIYIVWGTHGDGLNFCFAMMGLCHLGCQVGLPIYLVSERSNLLQSAIDIKDKEIELKEREIKLVLLENRKRNALLEE